jgi:hypothetical protein
MIWAAQATGNVEAGEVAVRMGRSVFSRRPYYSGSASVAKAGILLIGGFFAGAGSIPSKCTRL